MKKQILITIALFLAQGALAMDQLPPNAHAEGYAEGTGNGACGTYGRIYEPPIYTAAENGDYNKVAKLLKEGADVNDNGYGRSALAAAAEQGHQEVVKLLLKNHALVDARDSEGTTPLMHASTADIVNLLLRAGANINAIDNEGRSALHHALMHPNISVIQSLVENGTNIDLTDDIGMTPILKAASVGDEELVMGLVATPNRNMIERAIAGFNMIQKTQQPTKDIRWLLKQAFIAQLVEDQMNRIAPAINYNTAMIRSLMLTETGHVNENLVTLLDSHNPTSIARIRARVKENIERIILGEPRRQAKPAQELSGKRGR